MLFYFLFMWRTLPSFQLQTVFWDPILLREHVVYLVMEYINIPEFVLLPVNAKTEFLLPNT